VERADGIAQRGCQMRGRLGVSGEPPLHLASEIEIVATLFIEEPAARRFVALQRLMKERLDSLPALGIHGQVVD
jgi:hypothetical protein